jgi:hypothetical protein
MNGSSFAQVISFEEIKQDTIWHMSGMMLAMKIIVHFY